MDEFDLGWLEAKAASLAARPWALRRIADWLGNPNATPMLVVKGDPGAGKSSVLLSFLADFYRSCEAPIEQPRTAIASILRLPDRSDPFDSMSLLRAVIDGLDKAGAGVLEPLEISIPQHVHLDISVQQERMEVQTRGNVIAVALSLSSTTGLLAVAERMVRSVKRDACAVIAIDALDQAEDEAADEFLHTVAALVRAASGTGVRILCTTRTSLQVAFDPELCDSFDLLNDATDESSDLRSCLESMLDGFASDDRDRAVAALLEGADHNWLWATTNARDLLATVANQEMLPPLIRFTPGLDGLYRDGVRRMRQRCGPKWEDAARPLVEALACAFDERLGLAELRWILGNTQAQIEDIAHDCEPFLHINGGDLSLFHPDFSRWVVSGNVPGMSEAAGHLALAQGITEIGRQLRWATDVGRYAASRVIDHWCTVLLLDPFSPKQHDNERELGAVLTDLDWAENPGIPIDAIAQVASVVPTLRIPGSALPMGVAIQAVTRSRIVQYLVGVELAASLSDEQLDAFENLRSNPAAALRWLVENVPNYADTTCALIWGGLVRDEITVERHDGGLLVGLTTDLVLKFIDSKSMERALEFVEPYLEESTTAVVETLMERLRESLAHGEDSETVTAGRQAVLGLAYRMRAARQDDEDARFEDIENALVAFRAAIAATPRGAEARLRIMIDVTNTLRNRRQRTLPDLDELVALQQEIVEMRLDLGEASWTGSEKLLGDAYSERAKWRENEEKRDDLTGALAAYRKALDATPTDDESWLIFAIDTANALMRLGQRDDGQLDELIELQLEIIATRRGTGDPYWTVSAYCLGDAYYERAERGKDETATEGDLDRALGAYRDALRATPRDDEMRLRFAVAAANLLMRLAGRDSSQIDELIELQSYIVARRRELDEGQWNVSARLLGDAYCERAGRREDDTAKNDDLNKALVAYREALEATSPDDGNCLTVTMCTANALMRLDRRDDEQLDELIEHQREIVAMRREKDDPSWMASADLLGQAYSERAARREEGVAKTDDLDEALASHREALNATPIDDEMRLRFAVSTADALIALTFRDSEQLDELISLQHEIVATGQDKGSSNWTTSSAVLGNAYSERAEQREGEAEVRDDLGKALLAYRDALDATARNDENWLMFAVDTANALIRLDRRDDGQLDELIELLREIVAQRRGMGDPGWGVSAQCLGEAYWERAKRREADGADRDYDQALIAYRGAMYAAIAGDDHGQGANVGPQSTAISDYRLAVMTGLANLLLRLSERNLAQMDDLVAAQSEVVRGRLERDESEWISAMVLLGDAYRERALLIQGDPLTTGDIERALEAYRKALDAAPPDHKRRLAAMIGASNSLRDLPYRTRAQVDELIALQDEIATVRRESGDADWVRSMNLLGDAYRERADLNDDDEAKLVDLESALVAYREAVDGAPVEHEQALTMSVDLANALVVHAAVARSGGQEALRLAADVVGRRLSDGPPDAIALRSLLPVLRATLKREGRWQTGS